MFLRDDGIDLAFEIEEAASESQAPSTFTDGTRPGLPPSEAVRPPDALGSITEIGTAPDRSIGIDGSVYLGPIDAYGPEQSSTVYEEPRFARILLDTVFTIGTDRPASFVPLSTPSGGGPLVVRLDPALANAIANGTAAAYPVTEGEQTARPNPDAPATRLDLAPLLEPHGHDAVVHAPIFETDRPANDFALFAIDSFPVVPPITPPNGDGLGG